MPTYRRPFPITSALRPSIQPRLGTGWTWPAPTRRNAIPNMQNKLCASRSRYIRRQAKLPGGLAIFLRQGRIDEAFQQIRRALAADPTLTSLAVSRCWISTGDIDRILKLALPPNPDTYWGAIDFFMSTQEVDPAMAVWTQLASSGARFPVSKAFPFLDLLIQSGRTVEAKKVWLQTLTIAGINSGVDPTGSLLWNGSFEEELNGGFDWRYRPVGGTEVNFDIANAHGGHRSLRVVFDGTTNVDFADVWQYVVVEPRTPYRFSAFIRSQDLTTNSGMRFEIEDYSHPKNSDTFKPDPPQFTPNVVGTQAWTLDAAEFTTGSQTNLLRITLRRPRSDRFGNKISGTAWVDDVSLVPLPRAAAR